MVEKKLDTITEYDDEDNRIKRKYCVDSNGVKQGPYKEFDMYGDLREKGTYKDGEKDGPFEEYDVNGKLRERCVYKDGKKDGMFEKYDFNGTLYVSGVYKMGKLLSDQEAKDYLKELKQLQSDENHKQTEITKFRSLYSKDER